MHFPNGFSKMLKSILHFRCFVIASSNHIALPKIYIWKWFLLLYQNLSYSHEETRQIHLTILFEINNLSSLVLFVVHHGKYWKSIKISCYFKGQTRLHTISNVWNQFVSTTYQRQSQLRIYHIVRENFVKKPSDKPDRRGLHADIPKSTRKLFEVCRDTYFCF